MVSSELLPGCGSSMCRVWQHPVRNKVLIGFKVKCQMGCLFAMYCCRQCAHACYVLNKGAPVPWSPLRFALNSLLRSCSFQYTSMSEYYQGPNNSAKLKAVTLTLLASATILVTWRISWRLWKKVIGLPDYLLIVGLVSKLIVLFSITY